MGEKEGRTGGREEGKEKKKREKKKSLAVLWGKGCGIGASLEKEKPVKQLVVHTYYVYLIP